MYKYIYMHIQLHICMFMAKYAYMYIYTCIYICICSPRPFPPPLKAVVIVRRAALCATLALASGRGFETWP